MGTRLMGPDYGGMGGAGCEEGMLLIGADLVACDKRRAVGDDGLWQVVTL